MATVSFPHVGSFHRLRFAEPAHSGQCHVKYHVDASGKAIFLCSQLRGYTGTSVTDAALEIYMATVARLDERDVFHELKIKKRLFKPAQNVFLCVARTCRWIEHYPAGTGRRAGDSYSLVRFDCQLGPIWTHIDLAAAIAASDPPASFFDLSHEDLTFTSP